MLIEMKMRENLVGGYWRLLIILAAIGSSDAGDICRASSCGGVANISYPFQLRSDPRQCGKPEYELDCENNDTAILHLDSVQKFRVKEIDYHNGTITLVDNSIDKGDACSFPTYSLYDVIRPRHPYYDHRNALATPIIVMRCPNPLKNSSGFSPTNCANSRGRAYIKVGYMKVPDFPYGCSLDGIAFTAWNFNSASPSLSEIHRSLLYGFQLRLLQDQDLWPGCIICHVSWVCFINGTKAWGCESHQGLPIWLVELRENLENSLGCYKVVLHRT